MLDSHCNIHVVSFVAGCFLDLNFVLDSSGSINDKGAGNWNIILQFVSNVVRHFRIGRNDVQVALVLFSNVARVQWGLMRYNDLASLLNAIRNVPYLAESTNLNDALYLHEKQRLIHNISVIWSKQTSSRLSVKICCCSFFLYISCLLYTSDAADE